MNYGGQQFTEPLIGGRAYDSGKKSNQPSFTEIYKNPANPQSNRGGPIQPPINIRIMCPKHTKYIVQICLHTNCKDRLLCQRCVNEHTSSHVACFESPEEIFSSTKVEELKQYIHSSDNKRGQAEAKHGDFLQHIDEIFKEFYQMLEKFKGELKDYILDYSFPSINPTMVVEIQQAMTQFENLQRDIITSQACSDLTIEEFITRFHKLSYLHQLAAQVLDNEREIDYQTVSFYIKSMLKDAQDAMKIHLRKLDLDNLLDTFPNTSQKSAEHSRYGGFGSGGGSGGGAGGYVTERSVDQDFYAQIQALNLQTISKGFARKPILSQDNLSSHKDKSFNNPQESLILPTKAIQNQANSAQKGGDGPIEEKSQNCMVLRNPKVMFHARIVSNLKDNARALAYVDEYEHIAIGGQDPSQGSPLAYNIGIWNLKTLQQEICIFAHSKTITQLFYVPKQELLLSCSADCALKAWNAANGYSHQKTLLHEGAVEAVEYVPKSDVVVVCGQFKGIICYDLGNNYEKLCFDTGDTTWFTCLKYIDERHLLLVGCASKGQMWMYDWSKRSLLQKVESHKRGFSLDAISYMGKYGMLVTGRLGGSLQFWKLDSQNKATFEHGLEKQGEGVASIVPLLDDEYFVTTNFDQKLRFWMSSKRTLVDGIPFLEEGTRFGTVVSSAKNNLVMAADLEQGVILVIKLQSC